MPASPAAVRSQYPYSRQGMTRWLAGVMSRIRMSAWPSTTKLPLLHRHFVLLCTLDLLHALFAENWRRGSVVRTSVCSWRTFPDLRLIHG